MRTSRVLGLVVMVAAVGLFSGGAAGVAPGASAAAVAASPVVAAPAVTAPVVTSPVVAAPIPTSPAPAAAPAPAPAPVAAPVVPAAPALVPGTPCRSTVSACVDLSAKRAWLITNGVVSYGPVPITSGRKGYRTPTGTTRVSYKDANHRSSLYEDAPMPNSVFFNGNVAFHQGSLRAASHGCIHLSRTASRTFFASLSRGELVQVTS